MHDDQQLMTFEFQMYLRDFAKWKESFLHFM